MSDVEREESKKTVVAFITGVVKVFPVARIAPPVTAAYHFKLSPFIDEAPSVTVPEPHRVAAAILDTCGLLKVTLIAGCKQTAPAVFLICVE